MGVPVRLSPTCSSLFSCLPLPWLLPAPSPRRAWRPLRLLPTSTTPLVMLLLTIPLQLFPTSMMPLVMLLTFLPLKLRLTSMTSPVTLLSPTFTWSPLLPPLLPHPPSPTPPTLTPTASTPAKVEVKAAAAPAAVAPVTYAAYPHYAGYPYAVAAYHTGCVNNVGSVVPCA